MHNLLQLEYNKTAQNTKRQDLDLLFQTLHVLFDVSGSLDRGSDHFEFLRQLQHNYVTRKRDDTDLVSQTRSVSLSR
jgi:hypothetical protein